MRPIHLNSDSVAAQASRAKNSALKNSSAEKDQRASTPSQSALAEKSDEAARSSSAQIVKNADQFMDSLASKLEQLTSAHDKRLRVEAHDIGNVNALLEKLGSTAATDDSLAGELIAAQKK